MTPADATAPAAAADTSADQDPEAASATPDDGSDDAQAGKVLCTVMDMGDGTYQLIAGDEDDDGDEGDEGDEGAGDGSTAVEGEQPSKPEPETFDSVGALMKGILQLVKAAEETGGGAGAAFDEGYSGKAAAKA